MQSTHEDTLQRLGHTRLVPVVVIHDAAKAEPLAQALLCGGLDAAEVTFRTEAAEKAIRSIAKAYPRMLVGAGTLLTPDQVDRAKAAGATFGVAPGFNPRVVARAQAIGLPFVPGVATPTELEAAMDLGCRVVKFFPAQQAGGIPMLKAMLAAYGHTGVRFMPTGGVDAASLSAWLAIPEVLAVGGSWFVDQALIKADNWAEVERRTREALRLARA